MKIVVDLDKCKDHGECSFSAPEVFQLVDGRLEYVAEPGEQYRAACEEAVDTCPEQAISIQG